MTHGFDDHGSQFDGKGDLREWWTPADRKAFTERTDCEANEYSGFEAAPAQGETPALYVNGRLTLGENTADNGGLRIACRRWATHWRRRARCIDDKIDGFTEAQRYFIGFAQTWCQNHPDAIARQLTLSRSAFAGPMARQRRCAELRRVRQGLWLQERPAHVSRKFLPRLVELQPDSSGSKFTTEGVPQVPRPPRRRDLGATDARAYRVYPGRAPGRAFFCSLWWRTRSRTPPPAKFPKTIAAHYHPRNVYTAITSREWVCR